MIRVTDKLAKHNYFLTSTSLVMLCCNAEVVHSSGISDTHPNVILILADDMGYGDISALNESSKIHTPNIDVLAQRGIAFTDAHAASSVSTPSRYALLTGRYAFRTSLKKGVLAGYSKPLIHRERSTLGTLFSGCGYTTACIGKWHLGWNWAQGADGQVDYTKPITHGPTERGFDYFYGISSSLDMPPYVYVNEQTVTAVPNRMAKERKGLELFREGPQGADFEPETCFTNLAEKAIDYLEAPQRKEHPFFLYLPLTAPHTPVLPTAEFRGKSGLSPYGDFVLMIDDLVGRITSVLEERGIADNTIIIFTSDNGCAPYVDMKGMERKGHSSSYIYRGAKADIYDGGHRVPLIVSWGNRYAGVKDTSLVCLSDFYATFAQMCGVEVADDVAEDSYSLWPVLASRRDPGRKYAVHHSVDGFFSIRDNRWKLIFCGGSGGWAYPSLPKDAAFLATQPSMQLYDMIEDPGETINQIEKHPGVVEKMTRLMCKYITDGRSTPGVPQPFDRPHKWPQTGLFMHDF